MCEFVASTANDSALAGVEYVELPPTTFTIQSGTLSETVTVTINGDNVFGLDKQLFVIIDNPTNAVLGDSVGTLTIDEDDRSSPPVFDDQLPRCRSATRRASAPPLIAIRSPKWLSLAGFA